jgi:ABC-type polysaccharide/polyol phosphate export permease
MHGQTEFSMSHSARGTLSPLAISAGRDLLNGLRRWDIFTRLGWLEVQRRYRRTVIGPLWGAINLGVMVTAFGIVGGGLLNKDIYDYLPFLGAGMMVWAMISIILNESCLLFVSNENLFRQIRLNYSTLAYMLVWRNFIIFLHNIAVYFLLIVLLAPHLLSLATLLVIPALAVVLINAVWIALLLGMICLRFRDLQQLVATVTQISMFITPIFWPPESLQGLRRYLFVEANPLYSLIEIVRAPLLGKYPPLEVVLISIAITAIGWGMTYCLFARFRKRIAYWA